jgi:hypothetical protein
VIDYETYAKIHDCRDRQGLTFIQIARALGHHRPFPTRVWRVFVCVSIGGLLLFGGLHIDRLCDRCNGYAQLARHLVAVLSPLIRQSGL